MNSMVAVTMSHNNTIPARIFQKSLSDNESILASSHTNSIIPMNTPIMISNIFPMNDPMLSTFGTIPIPLYAIYFSI